MANRERSIALDRVADPGTRLTAGEMLILVYREPSIDRWLVTAYTESVSCVIHHAREPRTRVEAVEVARSFISDINFRGRVRWQMGTTAPVTDSPRV